MDHMTHHHQAEQRQYFKALLILTVQDTLADLLNDKQRGGSPQVQHAYDAPL